MPSNIEGYKMSFIRLESSGLFLCSYTIIAVFFSLRTCDMIFPFWYNSLFASPVHWTYAYAFTLCIGRFVLLCCFALLCYFALLLCYFSFLLCPLCIIPRFLLHSFFTLFLLGKLAFVYPKGQVRQRLFQREIAELSLKLALS